MDLEEWELLSKNSFKDLDEDDHGDMMMDYILCPSTQDPLHKPESPKRSRMVLTKPLQVPPIAYEPVIDHHENKKIISNNQDLEPDPDPDLMDSVPSPKVSFNKETEFVDMKIDPPVRITSPKPQIDAIVKTSDSEGGDDLQEKKVNDDEINDQGVGGDQKLNLWKVGLNGIGAICSFGAAAAVASVCVFFLGHNNIKVSKNKNQTLRFQIYPDDNKRMKEVVNHATKLNETIFAMKGVPAVRAQISFGGYYDGL